MKNLVIPTIEIKTKCYNYGRNVKILVDTIEKNIELRCELFNSPLLKIINPIIEKHKMLYHFSVSTNTKEIVMYLYYTNDY
ncbi:hypothetical protein [Tenacibaculum sp.]|uniref:hypothetical protein n=1 Tax=Tenacibaculum sp. TaxID=1906242 RepID=UPI003AA7FA8B